MHTVEFDLATGYLGKAFNRAVWRALTPDARMEARAEYRFMRRGLSVNARTAHGIISRLLALTTWDH